MNQWHAPGELRRSIIQDIDNTKKKKNDGQKKKICLCIDRYTLQNNIMNMIVEIIYWHGKTQLPRESHFYVNGCSKKKDNDILRLRWENTDWFPSLRKLVFDGNEIWARNHRIIQYWNIFRVKVIFVSK